MAVSIQFKWLSALLLMVGVLAVAFAAPAQQAAPSKPSTEKPQPRTDRYGDSLPPDALERLGTARLRSHDLLTLVACLPDGKTVLSVGSDDDRTSVCIWDISTGRLLRRFEPPFRIRDAVGRAAISPDGKSVIVAGYSYEDTDCRVSLLDVPSGRQTKELKGIDPWVTAIAIAADGKTFATASQNQPIRLWNRTAAAPLRSFGKAGVPCKHLAFSPDGKILAAAGAECSVQLWDAATGRELRSLGGHTSQTTAAVFSPDGKLLATACLDDFIRLWEPDTGKEVRRLKGEYATSALAFSPDGKRLVSGDAQEVAGVRTTAPVRLWDAGTGREIWHKVGHAYGVDAVAFSSDGTKLVSATSSNVLRVWDAASGKELLPLAESQRPIQSVAFSRDGKMLAAYEAHGVIRVWEPASDRPSRAFENGSRLWLWRIAFTPDGGSLVSYGSDGAVRFWEVAAGRETRRLQLAKNLGETDFDFSCDGRTVAVLTKGAIRLLDADNGEVSRRIARVSSFRTLIRLSPDGKTLASLDYFDPQEKNGILQLWNAETGKKIHNWPAAEIHRIVFSSDGRFLAGVNGNDFLGKGELNRTFHIWDGATGKHRTIVVQQRARLFSLAYSPDGRMLAWGDAEGAIALCEMAAGKVRHRFRGHSSFVNALSFAADGKTLASGSQDTTVLIWDMTGQSSAAASGALSPARLQTLWTDLADKDAAKAFDAVRILNSSPQQALALLKSKLQPALEPADRRRLTRLFADLDSDEFAIREKAMEQLRQFGGRAEAALAEALKNNPTLEAKKRIEMLLEEIREAPVSPENLRMLRAAEVLEYIGTVEAQDMLRKLADGAPATWLGLDAKASLKRLAGRRQPKR